MIDASQFKIQLINGKCPEPIFTVVSDRLYKLTQDYIIYWTFSGGNFKLTIPAGDETDGASTPPWTAVLGITPAGLDFGAAVVHDCLYEHQGALPPGMMQVHMEGIWENIPDVFTRAECDAFFKVLLLAAGVTPWRAWAMYLAVRACGFLYWSRTFKTAAG